jgi:hypothetical protein
MATIRRRRRRPAMEAPQAGILEQLMQGMQPMMQMVPMMLMQQAQYERGRADDLADMEQAEQNRIAADRRLEGRNRQAAHRAAAVKRRGDIGTAREALETGITSEVAPTDVYDVRDKILLEHLGPPGVSGYPASVGTVEDWSPTPQERHSDAVAAMSAQPSPALAQGDELTAEIADRFHVGPLTEQVGPTYPPAIPYRLDAEAPPELGSPPAEIETWAGQELRDAQEYAISRAEAEKAQNLETQRAEAFATAAGSSPVRDLAMGRQAQTAAHYNASLAAAAQSKDPGDWTYVNIGQGLGGNALAAPWRVVDATTGQVVDLPPGYEGRVPLTGFVSDVPAGAAGGNAPFVAYIPGTHGTGPVEAEIHANLEEQVERIPAVPVPAVGPDGKRLTGTPQANLPPELLAKLQETGTIPGLPGDFTQALDKLTLQNLLPSFHRAPTRHKGAHPVPRPLPSPSRFSAP